MYLFNYRDKASLLRVQGSVGSPPQVLKIWLYSSDIHVCLKVGITSFISVLSQRSLSYFREILCCFSLSQAVFK